MDQHCAVLLCEEARQDETSAVWGLVETNDKGQDQKKNRTLVGRSDNRFRVLHTRIPLPSFQSPSRCPVPPSPRQHYAFGAYNNRNKRNNKSLSKRKKKKENDFVCCCCLAGDVRTCVTGNSIRHSHRTMLCQFLLLLYAIHTHTLTHNSKLQRYLVKE